MGRARRPGVPPIEGLDRAAALLAGAETLFVFTGSGMSAESGIPTFRGPEGLWEGVRPEDVATPEAFARDPRLVWTWYRDRLASHARARPHAGHRALATLAGLYGRVTLATQNVDLLHERAGSRGVLHLHGSVERARCGSCANRPPMTRSLLRRLPPSCPSCGGLLRPDVVWFGELLPEPTFQEAVAAASACDACLVVGTSNLVHPAASLPVLAKQQGAGLVEVNPEPSALTELADVHLRAAAGQALAPLARHVGRLRRNRT